MKKLMLLSIYLLLCACALSETDLTHLDGIVKEVPALETGKVQTKNDILIENGGKAENFDDDPYNYSDLLNKCAVPKETLDSVSELRAKAQIYEICLEAKTTTTSMYFDSGENPSLRLKDYISHSVDSSEMLNESNCACFTVKFVEVSKNYSCGNDYLIQAAKYPSPDLQIVKSNGIPLKYLVKYVGKQCFIDRIAFDKETKESNKAWANRQAYLKSRLKTIYPIAKKYCEKEWAAAAIDCECFARYSYTINWYDYLQDAKKADRYYDKDRLRNQAEDAASASAMFCSKPAH